MVIEERIAKFVRVTTLLSVGSLRGIPTSDNRWKLSVMHVQAAWIVRLIWLSGCITYRSAGIIAISILEAAASVK